MSLPHRLHHIPQPAEVKEALEAHPAVDDQERKEKAPFLQAPGYIRRGLLCVMELQLHPVAEELAQVLPGQLLVLLVSPVHPAVLSAGLASLPLPVKDGYSQGQGPPPGSFSTQLWACSPQTALQASPPLTG